MWNKKGTIPVMAVVTIALISSLSTLGFYKTKQNGVLENNGKKIWCKMQNKGEAFCNEKYAYTPPAMEWVYKVPEYVESTVE